MRTYGGAMASTTLARSRDHRMIAGVCGGIAERFGIPVFMVRLAFVISCLLPGPQVVIYILLWILIPKQT